jgi:hypothetical protein
MKYITATMKPENSIEYTGDPPEHIKDTISNLINRYTNVIKEGRPVPKLLYLPSVSNREYEVRLVYKDCYLASLLKKEASQDT